MRLARADAANSSEKYEEGGSAMKIDVRQTVWLDAMLEEEEAFFRKYYEMHPEQHLECPCSEEVLSELKQYIESETRKFSSDSLEKLYKQRFYNVFDSYMTDDLLNTCQTDIMAIVHTNFAPAFFHEHTYFEILYVVSGKCTNYCGNKTLSLNAGDFLILAPGTQHAISSFHDSCRIINILIRSSTFENTFFRVFSEQDILYRFFSDVLYHYKMNTYILFHTSEDSFLQINILGMLENHLRQSYQEKVKVAGMSLIFSYLLNKYEGNAEVYTDAVSEKKHDITLILRYMQERHATVTLPELSRFFGYSQRHMTRILKSYTNEGFQQNLQHIRMQFALKYLGEGNLTIEEISEKLGYATSYSFRETFKQEFGMTPKKYQKNRLS